MTVPINGWEARASAGGYYYNTSEFDVTQSTTRLANPVMVFVQSLCSNYGGVYTQTKLFNERPDLYDEDQNRLFYWGIGDPNHSEGWYIADVNNKFVYYNSSNSANPPTGGWQAFTGDGINCTGNVDLLNTAKIAYWYTSFCKSTTQAKTRIIGEGTTGGTFSSTAGLSIDESTGTINPSTSTAGTYTITYSLNGGYAATTSVTIEDLKMSSVSISANPSGSITPGTSVTFMATPTNGGSTPTYVWKKNNTVIPNEMGATYTTTTLANGDKIKVEMTSNEACASPTAATSNELTMTVCTPITPLVTITVDPTGTVSPGTVLNFSANVSNGGTNPAYGWYKNGEAIFKASNATYSSSSLENGDKITVNVLNTDACGTTATSNEIVLSIVDPCAVIPTNILVGGLCGGYNGYFIPSGKLNGAPKWEKDGKTQIYWDGSAWAMYDSEDGGDIATNTTGSISNLPCSGWVVTEAYAQCGTPTLYEGCGPLRTEVTPSVTIAANDPDNSITEGTSVTFTATPTNGGDTPSYQWKKNGNTVGTNSATYTDGALANNDKIKVEMTSNDACAWPTVATSNEITMTVNPCTTPTAFNMTGGGAYCAGGSGVAIGLASSQTGVNYQLKKDNTNVGDPVAGTGNAISFGSQTAAGTYTVAATTATGGCNANMNGSAAVTIKPTPSSNLTASQYDVCPNTEVTLDAHCSIPAATVNWNPRAPTVTPNAATIPYVYKASCTVDGCTGNESSVEVRTHRILVDMKDLDIGALPLPIVRPVKDNMAPTNLIEVPAFPRRWTFIANGCDASESAVFNLSGPVNFSAIDNAATYALFANDDNGFYALDHPNYGNGGSFPNGTYTLTVDLRSRDGVGRPFPKNRVATGGLLATRTLQFTVQSPPSIASGRQGEILSQNEKRSNFVIPEGSGYLAEVMPNPVSNTLHLTVSEAKGQNVNVSLMDMSGRTLLQRSFVPESNQHQEEFEVRQLSNGMYFLKVNTTDKQTTLKVVKVE